MASNASAVPIEMVRCRTGCAAAGMNAYDRPPRWGRTSRRRSGSSPTRSATCFTGVLDHSVEEQPAPPACRARYVQYCGNQRSRKTTVSGALIEDRGKDLINFQIIDQQRAPEAALAYAEAIHLAGRDRRHSGTACTTLLEPELIGSAARSASSAARSWPAARHRPPGDERPTHRWRRLQGQTLLPSKASRPTTGHRRTSPSR